MCGRLTLRSPERIKFEARRKVPPPLLEPRFNIAPSQDVLTVMSDGGERILVPARWGLIPSWSKEPKGFINARCETLEDKPSFSESFQRRRCLIPADGFYEWKRNGKSKQPYYFQMQDEALFAFAGIWDEWRDSGKSIISCSIITTTPNDLLATIHDRMPAILTPDAQDRWLTKVPEDSELKKLLVPFPSHAMKSHAVSQKVNRAEIEEAPLVEPIEISQAEINLTIF